jgi:hypothetical protein
MHQVLSQKTCSSFKCFRRFDLKQLSDASFLIAKGKLFQIIRENIFRLDEGRE